MAVLVMLLAALVIPSAYDLNDPQADHTAQAIELDEAGDIEGAVESFRSAAKFEDSSEAWTNLGMALAENGESMEQEEEASEETDRMRKEAIECFNKAIERNPSNWGAKEELLKIQGTSECDPTVLRIQVSKAEKSAGQLSRDTTARALRTFKACGVVVLQRAYKKPFVQELLRKQTSYFDEYLERQQSAKKVSDATGTDSDTSGELRSEGRYEVKTPMEAPFVSEEFLQNPHLLHLAKTFLQSDRVEVDTLSRYY
jgi:tetratricopeptide (TPR) repeat protein